jgi:Bcl2-/adenovirus E1B nineteen kDa-interacting protein 2
VSQYQAEVCESLQKVTLVNTNPQTATISGATTARLQQSTSSPKILHLDVETVRHRNPQKDNDDDNDDSSFEESSYRAEDFGDDFDDEPPVMNSCDNNGNCSFLDAFKKLSISNASHARLPIPEYTAAEETKNVRNFNCIMLPDGKVREIDMKVS